jgi:hypothetical protein
LKEVSMLYTHPDIFKDNIRILMLTSRNKDNPAEHRTITKISKDVEQFNKLVIELYVMSNEGERIYASASSRDLKKAIRNFKQAQLDAEYDSIPENFYKHLDSRWVSALSQDNAVEKQNNYWLFDCDSVIDYDDCTDNLKNLNVNIEYEYSTKNGSHILVKPFNRSLLVKDVLKLLHTNAMMLWAYK